MSAEALLVWGVKLTYDEHKNEDCIYEWANKLSKHNPLISSYVCGNKRHVLVGLPVEQVYAEYGEEYSTKAVSLSNSTHKIMLNKYIKKYCLSKIEPRLYLVAFAGQ